MSKPEGGYSRRQRSNSGSCFDEDNKPSADDASDATASMEPHAFHAAISTLPVHHGIDHGLQQIAIAQHSGFLSPHLDAMRADRAAGRRSCARDADPNRR